MKNGIVILASAVIIFANQWYSVKQQPEEPLAPNPLICNQVQLLENKKSVLESSIKTKLAYQSFVLDTLKNKQK